MTEDAATNLPPIKLCPFCGGAPLVRESPSESVQCSVCKASGPRPEAGASAGDALLLWNRRLYASGWALDDSGIMRRPNFRDMGETGRD